MNPKPTMLTTNTARSADGETIRFASVGEGAPLVLLHGFSDSLETWLDLGYAQRFATAGRRSILIDARGHGGSGRPTVPSAYTPERRAADVVAVLGTLGVERADVLGYSLGGWTAFAVLRFHPSRVRCLVVGGAHPFPQGMAPMRQIMERGLPAWLTLVETQAGPLPAPIRSRLLANHAPALRAAVSEDREDLSGALAAFDGPCLLYAGSEDPVGQGARRAASLAPRGRYLELPGLNHMTALLRVDRVAPRVLEFLQPDERRHSLVDAAAP